MFRLLIATVLQATRSTHCTAPFISRRSAVTDAFRSSHCSIAPVSSCSVSGLLLYSFPVIVSFFYCEHLCFRNFNSTIPDDVIRMKSYVDSILDPTCVPVTISINKLDLVPNRMVSGLVSAFRNGGGLRYGWVVYPCRLQDRVYSLSLLTTPEPVNNY